MVYTEKRKSIRLAAFLLIMIAALTVAFIPIDNVHAATNISSCKINLGYTGTYYSGKAKCPAVKVYYNGKKLKKNTNYKVSYSSNVNPGTGKVTIKGKGQYSGKVTKTFKIGVQPANNLTAKYNSSAASIQLNWTKSPKCKNYKIIATANGSAYKSGTYSIKTNSYKFTGVPAGKSFSFSVIAYSGPKSTASITKTVNVTSGTVASSTKTTTPVVSKKSTTTLAGQATSSGTKDKQVARYAWTYSSKAQYNNWTYVFRFKDPAKAELAATVMDACCDNDHISYGTGYSGVTSLFFAAQARNWDVASIDTDVTTACSNVLAVCVYATGERCPGVSDKMFASGNALQFSQYLLKMDCFYVYTSADYTQSDAKLKRGDMIVTAHADGKGNHAAMILVTKN